MIRIRFSFWNVDTESWRSQIPYRDRSYCAGSRPCHPTQTLLSFSEMRRFNPLYNIQQSPVQSKYSRTTQWMECCLGFSHEITYPPTALRWLVALLQVFEHHIENRHRPTLPSTHPPNRSQIKIGNFSFWQKDNPDNWFKWSFYRNVKNQFCRFSSRPATQLNVLWSWLSWLLVTWFPLSINVINEHDALALFTNSATCIGNSYLLVRNGI